MDNINKTLEISTEKPAPEQEQPVNRLFFNARDWTFNKDCANNVGNRSFMQGPDGTIAEAFMIGDWRYNWTEIVSKTLILPKNTLHTFTFWLNGGENDVNDEVCRFEVIFNNDWDNRYTYNLNRNFIRPLKKYNGWELYEIPFVTADNEYTQLRFVAQRAYMTVMQAKEASAYAGLPDTPDEFEGERPQRHNIVFDDGYPTDKWYSTKNLRAKRMKAEQENQPNCAAEPARGGTRSFGGNSAGSIRESALDAAVGILEGVAEELREKVREELNSAHIADIVCEAADNSDAEDIEDISENVTNALEHAVSDMTYQLTEKLDELFGALSDLSGRLTDLDSK